MVDERFRFACALRHTESVSEEFFDDEEMWCGGEGGIKGEYGSGAFEAIAWEVKFGHGVY